MLISIHILNLLIALIDMKEGSSSRDMANVKSLPSMAPAAQFIYDCVLTHVYINIEGDYVVMAILNKRLKYCTATDVRG